MLRKLFKKGLATLLALSLVIASTTIVFGADITGVTLNIDPETNIVTIEGIMSDGEGRKVSVAVTRSGAAFYHREVKTGANGKFTVQYEMDPGTESVAGDASGSYRVRIGGAGVASAVGDTYSFINKMDGAQIVVDANGATTGGAMQTALETHASTLGISMSEGSDFYALTNKTAVYDALATITNFDMALQVANAFNVAVAAQTLNEADDTNSEALVMQYANTLQFDMSAESRFNDIVNASEKTAVYNRMTGANLPVGDTAGIKKAFQKAVYTSLFNEADTSNTSDVMDYIDECNTNGYASISLTDYNSTVLSDLDRLDIIKNFIAKKNETPLNTIDDAKSVFEAAATAKLAEVQAVVQPTTTPNPGTPGTGGNGGGGNGGGGYVISLPEKIEEPEAPIPGYEPGTGSQASDFTDLQSVTWAIDAINYLSKADVIAGVGDGKFDPNAYVTREQFVKMLMLGLDVPVEETEKTFNDVSEGAWYYDCVMNAYATNIVKGVDFDNFGVGQTITREQMCTLLYRAMNFVDIHIDETDRVSAFTDAKAISEYAQEAVNALYNAEVVNGISDTEFGPKSPATRAMAAQMIYKILEGGNRI